MPLSKLCDVWYSGCGGMAEWSIAAVLKTAGLTAPGVRIPFPPFQGAGAWVLNAPVSQAKYLVKKALWLRL